MGMQSIEYEPDAEGNTVAGEMCQGQDGRGFGRASRFSQVQVCWQPPEFVANRDEREHNGLLAKNLWPRADLPPNSSTWLECQKATTLGFT
jgi:hypothetical protein